MQDQEITKLNRVLVIDDNPAIHEDFRKILSPSTGIGELADAAAAFFGEATPAVSTGLDVVVDVASQGEEGHALVCKSIANGEPYALAFVDMRMPPGWDGLTTIEALWMEDPELQVVICSAYSDHSWSEIQERLGQTDRLLILKKPFENAEVLQLTLTLLEKRHLSRLAAFNAKHLETLVEERTRVSTKARHESDSLIAAIDSVLVEVGQDGTVNRWNEKAVDVLGLKREDAVGKRFLDLPLVWHCPEGLEQLVTTRTYRLELAVNDASGTKRFVGFSSYPIHNDSVQSGMLLLGADLTEHRMLESQLQQAQKLESVGQLAAGVAHEINTPMQYVGDNLDFLENKVSGLGQMIVVLQKLLDCDLDDAELPKFLNQLESLSSKLKTKRLVADVLDAIADSRDGVQHVSRIVRAMKEFAHPGQEEKIQVDVNHALESTIAVATNEWKYVAEIETEFDPSSPTVVALPVELNQVFLNILVNAAHAIGDATEQGALGKGCITVSTQALADSVEVSISDTGTGIPDDVKERIFDPFYTTKEVGKGTGQGLSIAHAVVVTKHEGRLWCESTPGSGTTFYIRIPHSELVDSAETEEPSVSVTR